ncbi:MAG TPA: hypothetical protein VFL80_12590 [Thermoanaerobaculia bacterium]|nr:hypothetical protein [Thermoanaerobaculia bacterium]
MAVDPDHQRVHIERAIARARDGVGDRIDELESRLREKLDVQSYASGHAPQLIAGGAVVGFLAGFGFPKVLRRAIQIGLPVALMAYKLKQKRDEAAATPPSPS